MRLLEEGQTVRDTYEVERFLGGGAFAEVYRVKHRFLGRQAMKVFKRVGMNLEEIHEMLGEAILLSRIGHPNIVRVFDANVLEAAQGTCGYFTMENIPGGAVQVAQRLAEARRKDPQVQLFPEITASIVGQDFMREGDVKYGIEVFKLVAVAYPDSADANDNLAGAYLKDGQEDLAKQHAEKALAILDSHKVPASSWTDTDEYRGEICRDTEKILKQLAPGS